MLKNIKKTIRPYLIYLTSIEELEKGLNNPPISLHSERIDTPEIQEMSLYELSQHLQKSYYITPNVYATHLKNIIYYPSINLLITPSKKIISDSSSNVRSQEKFANLVDLKKLYLSNPENIKGYGTVIHAFVNGSNYYHTLVDHIPRLYTLHQNYYQSIKEIKVLCSHELTEVESFFLKKLLPQNAQITRVDKSKLYLLEDFIFLRYLSRRFAGFLPSTYLNWFLEKVQPKRLREKKNRIFISRKNTRCILNEDEVFSVLKKYGFKKYTLENLSIEDQINLFYDAEFVIGTHGAGLTNIMFSEKIKVLELHPMQYILPHYYYLSKSCGHSYLYWCDQKQNKNANFEVSPIDIEKIIKANLSG